jgi:hypothetical protein
MAGIHSKEDRAGCMCRSKDRCSDTEYCSSLMNITDKGRQNFIDIKLGYKWE